MSWVVGVIAVLLIVASGVPLVRSHAWWIRGFDFPRLQLATLALLLLLAWPSFGPQGMTGVWLGLGLVVALGIQLKRIWPYTVLHPVQTQWATDRDEAHVRVMVANVLQDNRDAEALRQLVARYEPDVLLAVETDDWWERQLRGLENDMPYSVKVPQDNTYGMLLYSRYPLREPSVRYLVEDTVPSIVTRLGVPGVTPLALFCLHPRPPRPSQDTINRDAELVLVGREVRALDEPVLVAGDLNDVAWSHTTNLFQRLSALLDPRIGRGLYSTFNAKLPFIRFPLDHVFHSEHFRLVALKRLGAIGSDHFPALFELAYQPQAQAEQDAPSAQGQDWAEAQKIEQGARE